MAIGERSDARLVFDYRHALSVPGSAQHRIGAGYSRTVQSDGVDDELEFVDFMR